MAQRSDLSIIVDDTYSIRHPLARGKMTNLFHKDDGYFVRCRKCGHERSVEVNENGHPTDSRWGKCYRCSKR